MTEEYEDIVEKARGLAWYEERTVANMIQPPGHPRTHLAAWWLRISRMIRANIRVR